MVVKIAGRVNSTLDEVFFWLTSRMTCPGLLAVGVL